MTQVKKRKLFLDIASAAVIGTLLLTQLFYWVKGCRFAEFDSATTVTPNTFIEEVFIPINTLVTTFLYIALIGTYVTIPLFLRNLMKDHKGFYTMHRCILWAGLLSLSVP
jgi:hypothetical protein